MTLTLALGAAALMGLAGSLHCAGMCGPILWVMPFQQLRGASKALGIGLYHLGRIGVYAALGLVLRSASGVFSPGVQRWVSLACGAGLLVAGILSFIPRRGGAGLPWGGWVQRRLSRFMGNPAPGALFVTGALNGMLPCGLVYAALAAAVVAPTVPQAVATVAAFGLGTLPVLLAITLLRGKRLMAGALRWRTAAPAIMLVFGVVFVLRGASLGIPYLSPKIEVVEGKARASCCHKPAEARQPAQ